MRRLLVIAVVLLPACRNIDKAPDDLDEIVHFFWDQFSEGSDETLADGIVNLNAAVGGDTLDEFSDGLVSSLADEQVLSLGILTEDPAEATGVYLQYAYTCDMPSLEEILSYGDQNALYPVYDSYVREFPAASPAEFNAGDSDTIHWDLEYTTTAASSTYTAQVDGDLRRFAADTPSGQALVARAVLQDPAQFEGDGNAFLHQDYHLEMWWDRDDGQILHVYALWKDSRFLGFEDEAEASQRITLNNLRDWDDNTATLCETGLPQ